MAILTFSPLTLYCDSSGKEKEKIHVVAGFISTVQEWLLFEKEWAAVLNKFNVAYFHMNEFAHSIEEYGDGWKGNEPKRREFIKDLVQIIFQRTKYWVGCVIVDEDYRRVDADYELHERFQPYPLNGRTCIDMILTWQRAHNLEFARIKYVFEDEEYFGQLSDRIKERTGIRPYPATRLEAPPLQAADFAAYEVFRGYRAFAVEYDHLFERFRETFNILSEMPHRDMLLDEHHLRIICRKEEFPRRAQ